MMWLPVLWAYAVRFSYTAHALAAGSLAALCVLGWLCRDKAAPAPMDEEQKKLLLALAVMVIPLGAVSGYLQYTHSIRLAADGSYHVGQSTYGDLSLHLAICTSIVNAKFPLENSLMLGGHHGLSLSVGLGGVHVLPVRDAAEYGHGLHRHPDDAADLRRLRPAGRPAVPEEGRAAGCVLPAVHERRAGLLLHPVRSGGGRRDHHLLG